MMILKNRRHGWWWGCAILMTMWMPSGFAQSTTEMTPLETAAIDYEAALAELALPQEAWRNRYVDELAKLKTQVQAAGDLEQLLAIDRELASLESGAKSDILPKNKALYRLRSFYDKRTAQLAQVRVTGAREATLTYRKKLMAMQAAFTKTGKIDAALEVRAVLSGLTVPKVGQTAPTQGRPLAGEGNRRPGRLVIGGELYGGDTATIPEDMMDKPYVRVFAGQDLWYALTADGTVIHHDKGVVIENFPKDMKKPIVDVACGRYNYYGMHPDGSFTHWGLAKRMDKIPEGLTRVKGLAAGYSATIAWSPDGRAMIFGYTIDKYAAGKFAGPESFLQNVRTAAIGSDKVFVVKNDGTVEIADVKSGALHSYVPSGLKGKNTVAVAAPPQGYGSLFLTDEGKVYGRHIEEVPDDLPPVRQIRMGDKLGAVQLMDGTWRIFGRESAKQLNAEVQKLGPLKDLSLGPQYFIGIK